MVHEEGTLEGDVRGVLCVRCTNSESVHVIRYTCLPSGETSEVRNTWISNSHTTQMDNPLKCSSAPVPDNQSLYKSM